MVEFKHVYFLLLLIPYGLVVFWFFFRKIKNRGSAIAVSSEAIITRRNSIRAMTYPFLPYVRMIVILLLIIALARPGKGIHYTSVKNLGIDIMIALDVSGSMMGEDFQPVNRLDVAKKVITDFISRRKGDRVGMVIFAGDAYLQCPLTIEHSVVKDIISEVNFDSVSTQGTAIGDAIALSASRMMDRKAKSKVILLLTDGVNNRGSIDPETAAKACAEMGIKVYVVGIGKDGRVPYPDKRAFFGKSYQINQFDEKSLKQIAEITKAKFYRAKASGVLWENIKDIDRLEKNEVEIKMYHEFHDKFHICILIAAILFFIEMLLRSLFYRKIP